MTRILHLQIFPGAPKAERLDRWLGEHLPDSSRSAAQRLIRDSRVKVNARLETKPSASVHPGDRIEVEIPEPAPAVPTAQAIQLDIVYEDEHLLVLNKPVGLVVHPAAGNREGTLVNALLHHCRGLSNIGGVARPGIVHRLDKATSGLLVVAKSDAVHRNLSSQLSTRAMKRLYATVVWGILQPPAGAISAPIGRHPRDRKRMAVVPGGRLAVTHYRTLAAASGLAHLEVALETGRTHQIRVHLAHLNHPVVGDKQYGLEGKRLADRLAHLPPSLRQTVAAADHQLLHAYRLKFKHPVSGEALDFRTDPPDDLARVVTAMIGGD